LFILFAVPDAISPFDDVTLPEVRGTLLVAQYFIESVGAALAPLLAGLIAVRSSLHNAILIICVSAWVVCGVLFAFTAYLVPRDIGALRQALRERAEVERARAG
jgi:MFS family permease